LVPQPMRVFNENAYQPKLAIICRKTQLNKLAA